MTELPKQYDPAAQARWFSVWEENGDFNANPAADKQPHTIVIPLPNVTGALHMGHALNGTLQDVITRWRRMQGYEALWMPGTDHAGIATQAVVERRMFEEEGLTRHDIGREALVNRIWRWKDSYESRILNQLKQVGASCDWRRTRFTLDEVCSRAVRRTFFKMFNDGLVYRGKRLVNWDTFLQTAVADDEVFHEETDGGFWTFHYPVVDDAGQPTGEQISFSTTRPETMLGDTAVCVHPSDKRYAELVGRKVRIPLNNRDIPIIADALLADPELGTGAVKVTPAHDPNDYQCGLRNNLEMINILNPDGTLNENGGPWAGIDRLKAREAIVEEMSRLGYFDTFQERRIPLMHSDRSKTPIEPYLSDQWFIQMDDLAQKAIDAVESGRVRFFPSRYASTYLDWLGEKRDWCISRQLWWGHRIPIWSQKTNSVQDVSSLAEFGGKIEGEKITFAADYAGILSATFAGSDVPDEFNLLVCIDYGQEDLERRLEAAGFTQDDDVLDTWFSSALWPHSTLGWPDLDRNPPLDDQPQPVTGQNEVLDFFYPGSVLVTSRDIITLWVARMVLTGLYNMGDIPFSHVCVHPKILDGFGQTMSKSKGNGVDPMDLIDKYGTDAVRFTITSFAGETQDVRLPIGYECPHCGEVIPQTLAHQKAKPDGNTNPTVHCKACKNSSQYTSANFDPDTDAPVARMVSERFEYGRNFCNKLWNACRFALMNLEGYTPGEVAESELALEDRWILSRLSNVLGELETLLGRYQFDAATRTLRDFTWNEFCDWYLEMIKPRLRDEALRPAAQRVLVGVVDTLVRMLQPFTPFIAQEIWERLNEVAPERGLLSPQASAPRAIKAAWPKLPESFRDAALEARFARLQETIAAVRNVRAIYNIGPTTPLKLYVRCTAEVADAMHEVADQFQNLADTLLEAAGVTVERPSGSAGFSLKDADGFVPLEGIIDREAELRRQQVEAKRLSGLISGHEKKLENESFVSKAPADVVQGARDMLASLKNQLEGVQQIIADLER